MLVVLLKPVINRKGWGMKHLRQCYCRKELPHQRCPGSISKADSQGLLFAKFQCDFCGTRYGMKLPKCFCFICTRCGGIY